MAQMKRICAEYSSEDMNNVRITLEDNGLVINKTITFEEFKAGILACEKTDEILFRPYKMPYNYIDGIFNISKELTGNVAFFVQGQPQLMFFGGDKDGGLVPFPSLVFFFSVDEGKVAASVVFAVKETDKSKICDSTKLFNYPYGNVSPYNGRICWGGNPLKKCNSWSELEAIIRLFFNAPTNSDLYRPKESISKDISLPTLIKRVKDTETFDLNLLKPANATFGDKLKNIL